MLAYLALRRKSEIENLRQNSTSSDFAQIFTLGAEFCADHAAHTLPDVVTLKAGQTGIFRLKPPVFFGFFPIIFSQEAKSRSPNRTFGAPIHCGPFDIYMYGVSS